MARKEHGSDIICSISHIIIPVLLEYRDKGPMGYDSESDRTMNLVVNFWLDKNLSPTTRASIDVAISSHVSDEPLQSWSEMFEVIGKQQLDQLGDLLAWLNKQEYFLKACARLHNTMLGHIVHGGRTLGPWIDALEEEPGSS